jgi:glucose-6-phosphate dehydrogenase assembly protein OpcA
MSTAAEAIPDVCPELGIEVAVSAIDAELRKLWEQDEARTNASLINLVVYSEKPGALIENSDIVRELTRQHACRAILVGIDPAEPKASLRVWITAHCHLADGRKSVCCEQIAFYLTGKVTGRFRNTVFSHLNSDLPLIFWWQGELSDIMTERLVAVMDRLIIDSSSWRDPAAAFARIQDASQANLDLVIQDHAWTRSLQFRIGIANLFDEAAAQKALPNITEVSIAFHPAHRNTAVQLLAWFAVQAGWEDVPSTAGFAFESANGGAISVVLTETADGPALSEATLKSADTTVQVVQKAGASHVERRLESGGYTATSVAPVIPDSPAELVGIQLSRGGRNTMYRKIMPRFRKFLETPGSGVK